MVNTNNPLGFNESAWNDLEDGEKEKVTKIHDWDFSFLTGDQLLRHGVCERCIHDDATNELKRFFAVKVLRDIHPMGCFSQVVAEAWHAFILDTQRYEEFCSVVYGKTIHHIPTNYGKGVMDNSVWMSVYREWFGDFPRVWKLDKEGKEIPGYEHAMNIEGNIVSSDMDSDDGAF
uniref:Uncharacterized protein n=1 Tax=Candidatus Kentrum sp. LFY TaxID=2126342 RepID=A0A450WX03_9GAMM|nr:MAG: hypothetical protein BECKLFY1418C_GA0070996_10967 [Candidatus Kentron sp. LFY]